MSGTSLGRVVLELVTDNSKLNQGLAQAKQTTVAAGKDLREAARVDVIANLDRLKTDLAQARQLFQQGQAQASRDLLWRIRTDDTQLRTGLTVAERNAREAKDRAERQLLFRPRTDLAQLEGDLRTMEREVDAAAQRMAARQRRLSQELQQLPVPATPGPGSLPGLGSGGLLAGFVGGLGAGAFNAALGAISSGFDQVAKAGEAALGVTLAYNAAIQDAKTRIEGITGSQTAFAQAQRFANDELKAGRSTLSETLAGIAELSPVAKRSGADVFDLYRTVQLLATLNSGPGGGVEGAVIAINEALAGQFTSLQRRFNIPLDAIRALQAQGVPTLEIINRVLAQQGVTLDLVTARAQNYSQRQVIALDTLKKFIAETDRPIFDAANDGLAQFIKLLNDPAVKQGGAAFGNELAKNLNDVRHSLQELAGDADLRGIAEGLGKGAAAAGELYDSLEGVRRVVTLGGFERLLTVVRDFSLGVGVIGDSVSILTKDAAAFGHQVDDLIDKVGVLARLRDAAGLAPAPPVQQVGSVVAPQRNLDPEFDPGKGSALFDLAAQQRAFGQAQKQAYDAGVASLRAYLDGFSQQDFDLFGKLKPQLEASFKAAFAGLSPDEQLQGLLKIDNLAARITKDIDTIGAASDATKQAVRDAFGPAADDILKLVDAYGRAARAANAYTAATAAAGVAQGQLAAVTASANAAIAAAEQKLTAAQRAAAANQAQFQNQVAALQQALSAIEREAQQVARAYDDTLRGLQSALAASQRAGEEAQRQFAAQVAAIQRAGAEAQKQFQQQIEAAQQEQEAIQRAAQQHSEAFAAVLDNTTDEFLANKAAENEALDDQTRRILELGQAYQQYAREATAADHAVREADEQEAQTRLDFDRRIQAARQAGNEAAARALEHERDRVLARQRQNSQVTRDEAVVAGQKAQDARDPIEQERRRVAEQDKINGAAADKRVKEIQDQAKARAEADQAAIDAIQEQAKERAKADRIAQEAIQGRIDKTQEEARTAAQMYLDRKQGVQDEIDKVNERARQQKIADDAAILAAKQTLDVVKAIEDKRIEAAKQGAINAQNAANAAKAEYDAQLKTLDLMNQKNLALDAYIGKWEKFIEWLQDHGVPIPQFFGAPAAPSKPQSPVPGNVPETPPGTPTPAPAPSPAPVPPTAPAAPTCPPGSHPEYDAANDSWSCVKDGGFFGMVTAPTGADSRRAALPAYTAPAAPTSYYRAPVPPAPNVASYTAGLAAASLAPAPNGAAQVTIQFNKEIVRVDTLNAGNQQEIDAVFERAKVEFADEFFGLGLSNLEIAKRGVPVNGWRRG